MVITFKIKWQHRHVVQDHYWNETVISFITNTLRSLSDSERIMADTFIDYEGEY